MSFDTPRRSTDLTDDDHHVIFIPDQRERHLGGRLQIGMRLFRTFGAVSGAEQGNLRGVDNPSMQEIQLRPAEHLTFDQLEPVDVALDRAGAPWLGQGGLHCVLVSLQSSRE